MKQFSLILPLVLLLGFTLEGCAKRASWHQKLTLQIDTPNGLVTASRVVAVDFKGRMKWAGDIDSNLIQLRGEAIVAELGGRYLFVLLQQGSQTLMLNSLRAALDGGVPEYSKAIRLIKRQTEPLTVPRKLWPQMVSFADVNVPSSVMEVDPDNLAATFGAGYALREMTVQSTSEPVTEGRLEAFGFMKQLKVQSTLSGLEKFDPRHPNPVNYLTDKAFLRKALK